MFKTSATFICCFYAVCAFRCSFCRLQDHNLEIITPTCHHLLFSAHTPLPLCHRGVPSNDRNVLNALCWCVFFCVLFVPTLLRYAIKSETCERAKNENDHLTRSRLKCVSSSCSNNTPPRVGNYRG